MLQIEFASPCTLVMSFIGLSSYVIIQLNRFLSELRWTLTCQSFVHCQWVAKEAIVPTLGSSPHVLAILQPNLKRIIVTDKNGNLVGMNRDFTESVMSECVRWTRPNSIKIDIFKEDDLANSFTWQILNAFHTGFQAIKHISYNKVLHLYHRRSCTS